jgi:hypothetical protein
MDAAQTGHEDRSQEMRRQEKRNTGHQQQKRIPPQGEAKENKNIRKQKLISRRAAESRKRQSVSNKTKRRTPRA